MKINSGRNLIVPKKGISAHFSKKGNMNPLYRKESNIVVVVMTVVKESYLRTDISKCLVCVRRNQVTLLQTIG